MKRENFKELLRKKNVVRAGSILLSAIVLGTGAWAVDRNVEINIPELTTFVDMDDQISIGEEEVPLASAPKVTVKTKKTKKVVKLKKKAKKTKVVKKKATKKTTIKVKKSSTKKTTTKTETTTYVTEKYKKGSKKKTVLTTKKIKTTVTTLNLNVSQSSGNNTTSDSKQNANTTVSASQQTPNTSTSANVTVTEPAKPTVSTTVSNKQEEISGEVDIAVIAPKVDSRVKDAYKEMGFTVAIDRTVSYSGYFSARNQSITLRKDDDTIYHELGHFLAFVAGNVDIKAEFMSVYKEEKDLFVGIRKAYATQNSAEYFAESFREYTLDPITLKNSRPKTYQSIEDALSKVTDERVSMIIRFYAALWK